MAAPASKRFSLVTRFHLLLLAVMAAATIVAMIKVVPDYHLVLLWGMAGAADWSLPRAVGFLVLPAIALLATAGLALYSFLVADSRREMSRHVLEPALMWFVLVLVAYQFGLLITGLGSDIDLTRVVSFGLALGLMPVAILVAEVERHSYAGLRMPWPIASDRLFRITHRLTGALFALGGVCLGLVAWFCPDPGPMIGTALAGMLLPPTLAVLCSVVGSVWALRRWS